MAQHFLLSAAARTLGIGAVTRMTDEQVEATFAAIRWTDTQSKETVGWTQSTVATQ